MVYLSSGYFRRPLISKSLLRHPGDAELRGEPHELQEEDWCDGSEPHINIIIAAAAVIGLVPLGIRATRDLSNETKHAPDYFARRAAYCLGGQGGVLSRW